MAGRRRNVLMLAVGLCPTAASFWACVSGAFASGLPKSQITGAMDPGAPSPAVDNMPDKDRTSLEHLEEARELVWEALQTLEEAQRVLFKAGDRYVAQVWGDGVRAVLELTERITELSGDLTGVPLEIGRLARRDRTRDPRPPD